MSTKQLKVAITLLQSAVAITAICQGNLIAANISVVMIGISCIITAAKEG